MPAAWTTPRTWTAGELVTAAIGNSAWRDNLMYLKDSPTFDSNVTVTGTTLLTGVATLTAAPVFSSATASQAVFTDGSKALVSNAITGTGNVVMSASPTLTGTIAGAAMTLSSTLGVTGATTLSSTVATGALTVTGAATVSTTLGVTGATTLSSTLGVTGLITSTGGITGGAASHTTGAFSSTVTGGTYNSQTISSAASFTGTMGVAGLLTVSGAGTNTFNASHNGTQMVKIANSTSGAAAVARLELGNDVGDVIRLSLFSSTFTTSGANIASSSLFMGSGAGGVGIQADNASGAIRFYSGGSTLRFQIHSDGGLSSDSTSSGSYGRIRLTDATPFWAPNVTVSTGTAIIDNGSGYWYKQSSSARYKENIEPWVVGPDALQAFLALSPELWDYKGQQNGAGGFISEKLDALGVTNRYGRSVLVNYDGEGRPESNRDFAIIGLQHLVLQQHDATITQLAARIAALESQDN